jgi:predicted CoA-binding protein
VEALLIFIRMFIVGAALFALEALFLRILGKKMSLLRKKALIRSERIQEGVLGILLSFFAFCIMPVILYPFAKGGGVAEAAVVVSLVFSIPLFLFAIAPLWHSLCLIVSRNQPSEKEVAMESHTTCPMPDANPVSEEIADILKNARTIAVVGLSDNPEKDSNRVATYLIEKGYDVIPVNPSKKEILGRTSYPDIASVPVKIDVVDIFRPVEAIPPIVDAAIAVGAKVVWMQLGLAHPESAQKARMAGLKVIQSKCIKIEHSKIFGGDVGISFNLT